MTPEAMQQIQWNAYLKARADYYRAMAYAFRMDEVAAMLDPHTGEDARASKIAHLREMRESYTQMARQAEADSVTTTQEINA